MLIRKHPVGKHILSPFSMKNIIEHLKIHICSPRDTNRERGGEGRYLDKKLRTYSICFCQIAGGRIRSMLMRGN